MNLARRWLGLLLGFGLVACSTGGAPPPSPPPVPVAEGTACTAPEVATRDGPVCGIALEADSADGSGRRTVDAYLGIPYAASPAGDNRWRAPVPAARHDGVLEAVDFGPICPQTRPTPRHLSQNEDCLSVNVWTPRRGGEGALPVMVFIYGGSFIDGSSALPIYDGGHLAASGRVVVVSFNYRLGALGFLSGIDGLAGNYGFLDQQLALRWVRDNIARFGGDPAKVTLFGQSAGGMSIALHLAAPSSRDLFRAAIMESNPFGIPYKSPHAAERFAKTFVFDIGCEHGGVDCLRRTPVEAILENQTSLMLSIDADLSGFAGHLVWGPVIDGKLIPGQPNATTVGKPAIIGTNRNEGALFISPERLKIFGIEYLPGLEYAVMLDLLFPHEVVRQISGIDRYAPHIGDDTEVSSHMVTDYLFTCANRRVLKQASAPVFGYQFTHVPSFNVWPGVALCAPAEKRACHSAELPFVFGNPAPARAQATASHDRFDSAERTLSERMAGYWISFAETLDPNHDGAPRWPRFTPKDPVRQILDTSISQRTDLDANCAFWSFVGYDVPGLFARMRGAEE
jgi:carboxylesterase type B